MRPETPDVTLSIDGRRRHWVAEALIDKAIALESDIDRRPGKNRSSMAQAMQKIAADLRGLAAKTT